MRNVLFVSHFSDLKMGGQQSMFALISNLDKTRYRAFILMPDDSKELGTESRKIGCTTFAFPLYPLKPKFITNNFINILRIRKIIADNKIDIIHPDCERDSIICGFAKTGTSCRQVWHVRLTRPVKSDKYSAKLSDKIICISDACKLRFPQYSDKTTTIFNGVDCTKFSPVKSKIPVRSALNLPQDKFIVSFAGQYKYGKGIIDLVHAMNILKANEVKNVFLVMTGSPQNDNSYNEMLEFIANNSLGNYISVRPQQSEIYKYMQATDLLVLPSYEGIEGMGRVLFEAMACGNPVIGTNISGIREAITSDTGILVDEKSPESIASAILKFMVDQSLYSSYSANARQRALNFFDIKIHATKVMSLYDSLFN